METLSNATIILVEDTRVFTKLHAHITQAFDVPITGKVVRFDTHTEQKTIPNVLAWLTEGKDIALLSDAGTPLISDPGAMLVRVVREQTNHSITAIPGPSAVTTAVVLSGFQSNGYTFLGYLPVKPQHIRKILQTMASHPFSKHHSYVAFVSPHKAKKVLEVFNTFTNNANQSITIAIAKELTKLHEDVFRLTAPFDEHTLTDISRNLQKGELTFVWKYT